MSRAFSLLLVLTFPTLGLADAIAPRQSELWTHVRALADDACEGRAPGSKGSAWAIDYIAEALHRAGLAPAGDRGTYLQHVPMVERRTTGVISVRGKQGELPLATLVIGSTNAKLVSTPLVFGGYGLELGAADLHGKALVLLDGEPPGSAPTPKGRAEMKLAEAARRGAVAVMLIANEERTPWDHVVTRYGGKRLEPATPPERPQLVLWVDHRTGDRLLAGASAEGGLRPLAYSLSASLTTESRPIESANVLARLPGSDPKLSGETILVLAHHDGLGRDAAGHIYAGAHDNAIGVAAMLVMAEAIARAQPAIGRSIVFAATTGEESGLLGASWLAAHTPGKLVAAINLDGMNVWGRTRDLTSTTLGRTSLDPLLIEEAHAQQRSIRPEPMWAHARFYGSDAYAIARTGVPVVYLHSGIDFIGQPPGWGMEQITTMRSQRYHRIADRIEPSWHLEGAIEDATLLARLAVRLANTTSALRWIQAP